MPQPAPCLQKTRKSDPRNLPQDESPRSWAAIEQFSGRVVFPVPRLFDDLIPETYYPPHAVSPKDHVLLLSKLSDACDSVRAHDAGMMDDINRCLNTINLTPDYGSANRWSYSCGLAYFGAIFINAFATGVHGVAEALIHEYYHQRLWQWWHYEPLSGLPGEEVKMTSPVTGQQRSVAVMLQALMIYVEAAAYYMNSLGAGDLGQDGRDWPQGRLRHLAEKIPALSSALRGFLARNTRAYELLEGVEALYCDLAPGIKEAVFG